MGSRYILFKISALSFKILQISASIFLYNIFFFYFAGILFPTARAPIETFSPQNHCAGKGEKSMTLEGNSALFPANVDRRQLPSNLNVSRDCGIIGKQN